MRANDFTSTLSASIRIAAILPFAAVMAFGQQVNLTATGMKATLPDGSAVPMWGYSCGAAVAATCASLNPQADAATWSPVVITVPSGQDLTINLTNNLTFSANSGPANGIPTSLVIVGQLGGGLGKQRTTTPSPLHDNQGTTWPIVNAGGVNLPPTQQARVQSFSTEVSAGTTTALTWKAPRPGTYLIESGTHPSIQGPMGLYGMLVVTCAPADASGCTPGGTAYPSISYGADVPLLLSEIDPVQNNAVQAAVGTPNFSEQATTGAYTGNPNALAHCSGGAAACYPPAVNYTPLYYLVNGVAFDKNNSSASRFAASPGQQSPAQFSCAS